MVLTPAKLYVLPRFADKADIRLLDPEQKSAQAVRRVLFKKLPDDFALTGFTRVDRPEDADFLIAPQSVKKVTSVIDAYLDEHCATARTLGKKIIVFLTGDLCHEVHIDRPEVIIFTGSVYTRTRHKNEVVFSPFVEDLGEQVSFVAREKGEKPVVSFCGYAGFPSWKTRAKYYLFNLFYDVTGRSVFKRGIFYRRTALHALSKDVRIETRFIIRDNFSGNVRTISGTPEAVRQEYLANLSESDFVLCPKGDANFSSRFFETLSLGRIPVLIDTEMVLPLEKHIEYDRFIVRVPYRETARVGDYVMERFSTLSNEEFMAMQEAARAAYKEHLRFDSFYNETLPRMAGEGLEAVL